MTEEKRLEKIAKEMREYVEEEKKNIYGKWRLLFLSKIDKAITTAFIMSALIGLIVTIKLDNILFFFLTLLVMFLIIGIGAVIEKKTAPKIRKAEKKAREKYMEENPKEAEILGKGGTL